MFIFRHFFSLIFLVAFGLAGHVVWFSNTHRGSNPSADYWPPYCVSAHAASDACASVLSLANYFGQYKYSFGHYKASGSSLTELVRIDAFGGPMGLPFVPGSPADPDVLKVRAEACRAKGANDPNPWTPGNADGAGCRDFGGAYPAYIEVACLKVAADLQQGSRQPGDYPSDCHRYVSGFSAVVADVQRERDRQRAKEIARQMEVQDAARQDFYRQRPWPPGVRR